MRDILFVKYNRTRKEEFQISTTIYEENNKVTVEKKPLSKAAYMHIISLAEKADKLAASYEKVEVLKPKIINNLAKYEYLDGVTLEKKLFEFCEVKEELLKAIDEVNNVIFDFKDEYIKEFEVTPGFTEVFGNIEGLSGKAITVANIDCNYDNFIQIDDKLYCIDCEWVVNGDVPIEFLVYRSVFYFYHKYYMYLERTISYEEYMEYFGITPDKTLIYEQMEENSQHYVHGKDRECIYTQNYKKPVKAVENLEQDLDSLNQLQARDKDISWLNDLCHDKDNIIEDQKEIISKISSDPMYRLGQLPRKVLRKVIRK